MLRRLFSRLSLGCTTIALAADGIAMRQGDSPPQLLMSNESCFNSSAALLEALRQVAPLIKSKRVRLIISNHFVRYGLLDWRDGIASRQDWLELARHDFRQCYGAVSEQWDVRVSLQDFAQPVVTSAIDVVLLDQIATIASTHRWHVEAIEPLLMAIIGQMPRHQSASWLLIAEPEHVLICDGQHQFSVLSPPSGQEAIAAMLQIQRQIQLHSDALKTPTLIACIAPSLRQSNFQTWTLDEVNVQHLPIGFHAHSHHHSAVWMATL